MRLLFWRGEHPNFGDELNEWLWPRLIPGILEKAPGIFVGIGSILDQRIPTDETVVIFGAGARSASTAAKPGKDWDIQFVRGPLTAEAMGGVPFATDAAYCLKLLPWEPVPASNKIAFIPHIHSLPALKFWRFACWMNGFEFIDPRDPVESVIRQIRQSKLVIASAMHGAIIADVFRIPWIRLRSLHPDQEGPGVNDFKWQDWMKSIGLDVSAATIQQPPEERTWMDLLKRPVRWVRAAMLLNRLSKGPSWKSEDQVFNDKISTLDRQLSELKRKYGS